MQTVKAWATSIVIGVVAAGPFAALALVALPDDWRGPLVPWTVALIVVMLVVLIRQPRQPPI
ncbi:MAG: hypothetical protein WCP29_11530 [Acidobacteriota bacterium]